MLDDWLKIALDQFHDIIYYVRNNYNVIKFLMVEKKMVYNNIFEV